MYLFGNTYYLLDPSDEGYSGHNTLEENPELLHEELWQCRKALDLIRTMNQHHLDKDNLACFDRHYSVSPKVATEEDIRRLNESLGYTATSLTLAISLSRALKIALDTYEHHLTKHRDRVDGILGYSRNQTCID